MSFWETVIIAGAFLFMLFAMVLHFGLKIERKTKEKDIQTARRVLCEFCKLRYKCTEHQNEWCSPGNKMENEILDD